MDHTKITSERQFKSTCGHSQKEFKELYKVFEKVYFEKYGQTYEDYHKENVVENPKLSTLENCLFFVLFQLKNDMLFDTLGAVFKMDGSTAHKSYKKYLDLLEKALQKKSTSEEKI